MLFATEMCHSSFCIIKEFGKGVLLYQKKSIADFVFNFELLRDQASLPGTLLPRRNEVVTL